MSTGGQVVLFKAPNESGSEEDDVYHEALRSVGFDVISIPVLDFDFVNLDEFLAKLKSPGDYDGIVFSSPRCVKGCRLAVEKENNIEILAKWRNHSNFAVGESTAKAAEELGLDVKGKEQGNADALADLIAKTKIQKPLLYPKGSLTKDTFKLKLKGSNIDTDDIVIYRTKPHPNLKISIADLCNKIARPVFFLYFSPSGVNFTMPMFKEMNFDLGHVNFVAIGPTTEKELKANGLKVHRTVAKPTPLSTVEALTS